MKTIDKLKTLATDTGVCVAVFARDVGRGLLDISHNSLAAVGLLVVALMVFFGSRGDLRHDIEVQVLDWLQTRHAVRAEPDDNLLAAFKEPQAVERATAAHLTALTRQQASVVQWISRRYRVAPEPVARLVQEAWSIGQKAQIDPTLILAIIAIESSFNPFAQSPVGAQGLMQVMTAVHDDKYEPFGGTHAAFDPVTNLRVGVQVLKECIARAGSLEAGLKYYVGAANLPDDQGYAARVLTEQTYLRQVADGRSVPSTAPAFRPSAQAAAVAVSATSADLVAPVAASAPAAAAPAAQPSAPAGARPETAPAAAPAPAEPRPADGRVALLAN